MSLSKIAKISGCSVSTVSKAFHDSPEVSTKTKEKIFDVAQSLGYYNKYYKPTMDYKTIAVLCPDINSPFYCSLLNTLQNKIEKKETLWSSPSVNLTKHQYKNSLNISQALILYTE